MPAINSCVPALWEEVGELSWYFCVMHFMVTHIFLSISIIDTFNADESTTITKALLEIPRDARTVSDVLRLIRYTYRTPHVSLLFSRFSKFMVRSKFI